MTFEPLTLTTVRTSSGVCHKIGPLPGAHGRETGMACVYDDYPAGERSEKLLAYARLFAAAPDLLAALVELLEQLDVIGIPDWHGAEGLSLDAAQAAIRKAKGGDS